MDKELENTDGLLHWAAGYKAQKPPSPSNIRSLAEIERIYIETVLNMCRGNVPRAAALLQISTSTLYRKRAKWEQSSLH